VILCGFMLTLVKNTTADLFQPTEPTTNKWLNTLNNKKQR
jgi:hypothetical protein